MTRMKPGDPVKSGAQPLKATTRRCSHCHRELGSKCLPAKMFYYETHEDGEMVKKRVLISDALREIFQWRCFGYSKTFENGSGVEVSDVVVCGDQCGIAIAKLYSGIKLFDSLVHPCSLLSRRTQDLLEVVGVSNQIKTEGGIGIANQNDFSTTSTALLRQLARTDGFERPAGEVSSYEKTEIAISRKVEDDGEEQGDNLPGDEGFSYAGDFGDDELGNEDDEDTEHESSFPNTRSKKDRPYLCQICGRGLTTRQCLKTHELLTHKVGAKEMDHECGICGKKFYYMYLLRNHERSHSDIRDYPCQSCSLKFKSHHSLKQHLKDVHEQIVSKFPCRACNKSFKHARTLWEHVKSFHGNKGGKQVHACKYGCGSVSARSRSILRHLRICKKRPQPDEEEKYLMNENEDTKAYDEAEQEQEEEEEERAVVPLYDCQWDCGNLFRDKAYRNKHEKYVCRKRPNKNFSVARSIRLRSMRHQPRKSVGYKRTAEHSTICEEEDTEMYEEDVEEKEEAEFLNEEESSVCDPIFGVMETTVSTTDLDHIAELEEVSTDI